MNQINFNSPGGFPFDTQTLDFMQQSYALFNQLGYIAGDKAIITGCVQQSGRQISDGVVFINGELLPFRGGTMQPTVIIVEEVTNMTYQDGTTHPVEKVRYATFGTGQGALDWSDFKRVFPFTSGLFIDEVRMYAGDVNNIPQGWYLCNGQNGTVDLRGRFIVGYNPSDTDYDNIGKTGGAKNVALTVDEMPAHNHPISMGNAGYHRHHGHVIEASDDWLSGGEHSSPNSTSRPGYTDYAGAHTHSISMQPVGGGNAHENRPPYYTLAFIQFKGI